MQREETKLAKPTEELQAVKEEKNQRGTCCKKKEVLSGDIQYCAFQRRLTNNLSQSRGARGAMGVRGSLTGTGPRRSRKSRFHMFK